VLEVIKKDEAALDLGLVANWATSPCLRMEIEEGSSA
jgi:hypothetical protein